MKTGRMTYIRDAILSGIKRFVFEVPIVDNRFPCTVLTYKCQVSESQKNLSFHWVEHCSGVASFGSAAFTLLLWEGWRPQSSICFPLWNKSGDPICHFWETAAAPARGPRKGRQKNIICYYQREGRVPVSKGRSFTLQKPQNKQGWQSLQSVPFCERKMWLQEWLLTATLLSVAGTASCSLSAFRTPKQRNNWV